MQPRWPHQQAGPGCSSASIQGRGLWPHSPATRFRPSDQRPPTTTPAPVPVPRMAAKTVPNPAPAPSAASLSARQFASLAMRTGRPRRAARSVSSRPPFNQVLFAPRTSPVVGERLPGIPTPTVPPRTAQLALRRLHQLADQRHRAGVGGRRRRAAAQQRAPVRPERHDLRLGPAEVDSDSDHAPRKWRNGAPPAASLVAQPAAVLHSPP